MHITQEKQIDLREIWQVITKRKWLLILPFVIVLGISYFGSYLMKPKFESSVVILTSRNQIVTGELARIIPGEWQGNLTDRQVQRRMQEIKGLVTSGVNMVKLVTQLRLDEDPAMLRKAADLQERFPNVPQKELIYRALIDELRKKINVDFISENLIRIAAQNEKAIMARNIAQTLAEGYREEQLRAELLQVRSRLEFSNTQAQIYKKDWEEKEAALAEFKRDYQKFTIDRGLTTEENLRDLESELDRTRLRDKAEVNDRLADLETRLSAQGIDPANIIAPTEIQPMQLLLEERTSQLAQLMEKYTWRDPKVNSQNQTVAATLDTIRLKIEETTAAKYANLSSENRQLIADYIFSRAELQHYIHKESQLQRSKDDIKNRFTTGPNADIQLSKLEKDAERAKQLYDDFLESYTGSQLAMEIYREDAENRYKIIEPAYVPLAPYWPNRLKITILGCALGLLLGIGALILAEVTDNSIKKIETIEKLFNIKVLGTIPRIESRPEPIKPTIAADKKIGSKA